MFHWYIHYLLLWDYVPLHDSLKGGFNVELVGVIFTGIGVLFLLLGNFGILRLPDVYNRIQAGTKCTTFGTFFTIIGIGIIQPEWFWKCLLIAVFVLVTNPISSHAIARASKKIGVPLCDRSVVDQTKEFVEREET
ncbi:MAG: cation:proton antiporter [Candidatus Neomarinimicrobiota bacterium]|nr:MAG: cation:proton antiporter [Candidatus Neomarinimicrobiota bacterium]